MRALIITLVLAVSVFARQVTDKEWQDYKTKYGKWYPPNKDAGFRAIYQKARDVIDDCNEKKATGVFTFSCKESRYCDQPRDETDAALLGLLPPTAKSLASFLSKQLKNTTHLRGRSPPPYKNWAEENQINPVVDQGGCGSCYAFATAAAIEGHNAIQTGSLVKLSEQQIVDCSLFQPNYGCQGGLMDPTYEYYMYLGHGAMQGQHYGYVEDENGRCSYDHSKAKVFVKSYKTIRPRDAKTMKDTLGLVGPLAVAMSASPATLLYYDTGVYNDPGCSAYAGDMNHAVTIVGYGRSGAQNYWIVRNSWGAEWGDRGYFRIENSDANICGMTNMASYPIIDTARRA